jgi:hypothetical protein
MSPSTTPGAGSPLTRRSIRNACGPLLSPATMRSAITTALVAVVEGQADMASHVI